MDKIKAFIKYALGMEQKLSEAFQLSRRFNLFENNPQFGRLQNEMEQRAKEVGVFEISKKDDSLIVSLQSQMFEAMNFSNVEEEQTCTNGVKWIHYRVLVDGVIYVTCKKAEIKNASA